MPDITQARILIIATDGFEQSELQVPRDRLLEAGFEVEIASPNGGGIRGWKEGDWGDSVVSDLSLSAVKEEFYDALVIPGGQINSDNLRLEPTAVELVQHFYATGKLVAAICHGPWLLVEADVIRGKSVTSFASIRKDLENAGGHWEDSAVVTDKGLITSRNPGDLDAFCQQIIEEFKESTPER